MSANLKISIPYLVEDLETLKCDGIWVISLEELIVRAYELSALQPMDFEDQLKIREALNQLP